MWHVIHRCNDYVWLRLSTIWLCIGRALFPHHPIWILYLCLMFVYRIQCLWAIIWARASNRSIWFQQDLFVILCILPLTLLLLALILIIVSVSRFMSSFAIKRKIYFVHQHQSDSWLPSFLVRFIHFVRIRSSLSCIPSWILMRVAGVVGKGLVSRFSRGHSQ